MSTRRRFLGLLAAAPVAASMPRVEPAAEVVEAVAEPVEIVPAGSGARFEINDGNYRVYDETGALRVEWGVLR